MKKQEMEEKVYYSAKYGEVKIERVGMFEESEHRILTQEGPNEWKERMRLSGIQYRELEGTIEKMREVRAAQKPNEFL